MPDHQATDQQASVRALMARYASAFRKHSAISAAEAAAAEQPLPIDQAEQKRRAAEKRELEFFLERLRSRLQKSGLSASEVKNLEAQPEGFAAVAEASRSILKSART